MSFELISASHAVGEANYHMQFTPAYRKSIFGDDCVKTLTRDYLLAAGKRYNISISAISFGPDHCHLFVVNCKNHSPAQVAGLLKGFSSHMMRKHHAKLFCKILAGKKFWTSGYFYRTVGAVNTVTIQHYVEESQSKHWKHAKQAQTKLIEFNSKHSAL